MEEALRRNRRRAQQEPYLSPQAQGQEDGNYTQFFRLQEGEKIVEAMKPLSGLKWMFFFQGLIGWFFFMLFVGGFFFVIPFFIIATVAGPSAAALILLVGSLFFLFLMFIVPYIFASLSYGKRFYWITNKRIIGKSGLIGYKVNSIPLERISDVIISRSFIEQIFGFGSVHIQTLAGQVAIRGRFGAEGNFQAVPDPEGLQQRIFELVKKKRKAENLTM